jgi:hypothetical protein
MTSEGGEGRAERILSPWLIALALATTAMKLVLLAKTEGSNDAHTWIRLASTCLEYGPFASYRIVGFDLNHPLLGLLTVSASLSFGRHLHLGSDFFWVRVPALAGDLLGAVALGQLLAARSGASAARRTVAFYLASPLVFLVGLFHGNTDILWVAGTLHAALALEKRRPALAGLLLAAAAAVKLPAVVFVVPLALAAAREKAVVPFATAFGVTILAFFLPPLLLSGDPFVRFVLGYRGIPSNHPWPPSMLPWSLYAENSAPFIILATVVLALVLRQPPAERVALTVGVVLVLMPRFGIQYLGWFALPVMVVGLRAAIPYHFFAAYQAALIYLAWGAGAPPYCADSGVPWGPIPVWPSFLTWASILLALAVLVLANRRTAATASLTSNGLRSSPDAPEASAS